MSIFALDSNIISFYLKGNTGVIENIEKAINEDHAIIIPPKIGKALIEKCTCIKGKYLL